MVVRCVRNVAEMHEVVSLCRLIGEVPGWMTGRNQGVASRQQKFM